MPAARLLSEASRLRHFFFAVALVGVPVAGSAQEQGDPRIRLFQASSIRCQFQEGTEATWEDGRLNIERSEDGEEVTFDSINSESGTARLIAEAGAADVRVMTTEVGFTFLEVTDAGNLVFTTVFASKVPGRPGHYIAVDSHHIGWPASWPELPQTEAAPGPFPAQYHGTCEILE